MLTYYTRVFTAYEYERLWKRGRKGIMVSVGWSWWEQAGHGLVELITGCTIACFRKQTEKK